MKQKRLSLVGLADGSWLLRDGGLEYRFDPAGLLSSVASAADAAEDVAPTYSYGTPVSGGPTRLVAVTDTLGRNGDYAYGGGAGCPHGGGV